MKNRLDVVFDLDGTLVDTAQVVERLIAQMRAERCMAPLSREQLIPFISIGGLEMIMGALDVGGNEAERALRCFRALYAQTHTALDAVYPGVPETLEALVDRGVVLSICTNKPRALAIKVLTETGLLHYFRQICAGDDLLTRKPNKLNLETCLGPNFHKSRQIYVVGDSTIDEALSRNAGVPFLLFSGGYDDGVERSAAAKNFCCYEQFPLQELLWN